MKRSLTCLTLASLLALPQLARAQTAQAAAAEGLFQQGMKALQEKRYDEACEMLRRSDTLDPANGTKLNLARCEEQRGKLAIAWSLYKSTLAKLPATDARLSAIQERITALEPRIPTLTVRLAPTAPKDTKVTDGEVDLTLLLDLPVTTDPGKHTLVVEASGYERKLYSVDLPERTPNKPGLEVMVEPGPVLPQTAAVSAPPLPSPAPAQAAPVQTTPAPVAPAPVAVPAGPKASPVAPSVSKPTPPQPPARTPAATTTKPLQAEPPSRTPGFLVGGLGAVFLGVGATSYMMALGKVDLVNKECSQQTGECSQAGIDAINSANTLNVVSLSSLALGAVGVGTGLWLTLSSAPRASHAYTAPALVAGAPGWTFGGAW